jgi:hypothetical protein
MAIAQILRIFFVSFVFLRAPATRIACLPHFVDRGYFNQPLRWNIQNGIATDSSISNSASG